MKISFACGKCSTVLEADAQSTGQAVVCPRCNAALKVPPVRIGPGVTIGGFRIKKLIARGGMGEVYLAEQLSLGRDVALKVLPPHFKSDPETVSRFLAEVRTAAKLQHPNLVTVYEAGEDNGVYFLAMAYIDGETLDEKLNRDGAMPEAKVLEVAHELGSALSSAWESHRLIHCDVKPGNIMLDRAGKPHLMDMGLSKLLTESTASATPAEAFGTPNYVSPEQSLNAAHLDFRSDMFSLGMTMYHMLTGRIPFDAPTPAETLHKLDTETLPDPRTLGIHVSPGCVVLLEIMLARDPSKRYPDWESLLKDINRVRKGGKPLRPALTPGESVLGRTPGPSTGVMPLARTLPKTEPTPPPKPHSKRSFVFWTLAFVAVLMINIIGVYQLHGGFKNWVRTVLHWSGIQPSSPTPTTVTNVPAETETTPAPLPPMPPTKNEDDRLAVLQKRFNAARLFERNHPDDFAGAIQRFEQVQQDGAGTVWADRAAVEVQRLKAMVEVALAEFRKQLKAEVDRLVAEGKIDEAIEMLRNYTGRFRAETLAERTALAEQLRQEKEKKDVFAGKFKAFAEGLADELLRLDLTAAQRRLSASEGDTTLSVVSDFKPITEMAQKVAAMPEVILESFKRQTGKEVTLSTRNGPDKGEVLGVEEGRVQLKKKLGVGGEEAGFAVVNYRVSDLTLDEWMRRLTEKSIEQELMRGLLICQSKALDKARETFQQTAHPLGILLANRIRELQAAAAAREKAAAEAAAQTAYNALLKLVGLGLAEQDPSLLPTLIRRAKVSEEVKAQIQRDIQTYWTHYGKTDWAKQHQDVLVAFAEVGTLARTVVRVDADAFDKAIEKLKAANPGPLRFKASLESDGIVLSLRRNENLVDLSPLAGLPIKSLNLAGCVRLRDISPLQGMPLEQLNLDNTAVADLMPLVGAPLKELSLNGCVNIRSLKALGTAPLEYLGVSGCSPSLDLSPVSNLPTLKQIDK